MKFVRVEYDNKDFTTAELTKHREIIEFYVKDGYKYVGFVPIKYGSNGQMQIIDLIFE